MEWIELKNKKPPYLKPVLIYTKGLEPTVAYLLECELWAIVDWDEYDSDLKLEEVTHWMPLPEEPRPVVTMFKKEDFEVGSKTGIAKGGYASSGNFDEKDCYTKKIIVNLPENCRQVSIKNMQLEIILKE